MALPVPGGAGSFCRFPSSPQRAYIRIMHRARVHIGFLVILVLIMSGQAMTPARGSPAPIGQMTLCTGNGPVTVLVDSEGRPTGAVYICPDCALSLFDLPATITEGASFVARAAGVIQVAPEPAASARSLAAFRARAPPPGGRIHA